MNISLSSNQGFNLLPRHSVPLGQLKIPPQGVGSSIMSPGEVNHKVFLQQPWLDLTKRILLGLIRWCNLNITWLNNLGKTLQFWPDFTVLTTFRNVDQIIRFWLRFTLLTKFWKFDYFSQFQFFTECYNSRLISTYITIITLANDSSQGSRVRWELRGRLTRETLLSENLSLTYFCNIKF